MFTAGELARASGVSTDTLRHYESKGVIPLPHRAANGYRQYPVSTLLRLRLVRRALAIGFSLDELSQVLALRDRGGTPCEEVHRLATDRLARVEEQLRDLSALRDELRATIGEWEQRLAKTPRGKPAGLLTALLPANDRPAPARRLFSTTAKNNKPNKDHK